MECFSSKDGVVKLLKLMHKYFYDSYVHMYVANTKKSTHTVFISLLTQSTQNIYVSIFMMVTYVRS